MSTKSKAKGNWDRMTGEKTKTGVPLGTYVINPFNGDVVPIWIADYVLMNYRTGAVVGECPVMTTVTSPSQQLSICRLLKYDFSDGNPTGVLKGELILNQEKWSILASSMGWTAKTRRKIHRTCHRKSLGVGRALSDLKIALVDQSSTLWGVPYSACSYSLRHRSDSR